MTTERLCFVHIPKTAGTTLSSYLQDSVHQARICPAVDQRELELQLDGLDRYDLLRGHFMLSRLPGTMRSQFKLITFLRDPIQRAISSYHHWLREPRLRDTVYRSPLFVTHNAQVLTLTPISMLERVSLRTHLDATKALLEDFFFVGVVEHFAESFLALSTLRGLPVASSVRQRNVGHYDTSIPEELIQELIDANWADIELYAYAVDLFKRKFLPLAQQAGSVKPSLQLLGAPVRGIHYRMDSPLVGAGWHEREGFEPENIQRWRWTGPEPESHIYLSLAPNIRYRFSIRVLNSVSVDILRSMRVAVNEHTIALRETRSIPRTENLPGLLYEGVVTPAMFSANDALTKVTISVDKTIPRCEADPNSTSTLRCGLAITEINFDL